MKILIYYSGEKPSQKVLQESERLTASGHSAALAKFSNEPLKGSAMSFMSTDEFSCVDWESSEVLYSPEPPCVLSGLIVMSTGVSTGVSTRKQKPYYRKERW